jgi:hypothetical protein
VGDLIKIGKKTKTNRIQWCHEQTGRKEGNLIVSVKIKKKWGQKLKKLSKSINRAEKDEN